MNTKTFLTKLLAGTFMIAILTFALPLCSAMAAPKPIRLAGQDRYTTAIEISKAGWQLSDNVVLATGEDFPDALCAAPLAKQLNAPILLTGKARLNTNTANELKRLKVKKVYIVGGPGVVSNAVAADISSLTYQGMQSPVVSERIYGSDRASTSVEVAKKINGFSDIVVATGDNYPDALSIAPVAAKKGMPIILVSKNNIAPSVDSFMKSRNLETAFIIGGAGVISDNVMSRFITAQRVWGNDRYETNINIINRFSTDIDFTEVFIATGEDFPDALAGSALAAKTSSAIVLTPKVPGTASKRLVAALLAPGSTTERLDILGGEGVVPQDTIQKLSSGDESQDKRITIGSTEQDIKRVFGNPKNKNYYNDASDTFDMYYDNLMFRLTTKTSPAQVIGWNNRNNNPNVGIGYQIPTAPAITMGSSKEDVARALGSPYAIDNYSGNSLIKWYYNYDSMVMFDSNYKVDGWVNNSHNLKITMGQKDNNAPPFTIGSSSEDVIKAMGTPDELSADDVDISFNNLKWKYGNSYIYFAAAQKVKGYENKGDLKVYMGTKDKNSPGFTIGSSTDELLKAMGTPDSFISNGGFDYTWKYEDSTVTVSNQGKVTGWLDRGNLNIKGAVYNPSAPPVTVGSTQDDVLAAMGNPNEIGNGYWRYRESDVEFTSDGKVSAIDNRGHNIKVANTVQDPSALPVALGSTIDDVMKALGSPDYVCEYEDYYKNKELVWRYGSSEIMFDSSNKVHRWVNRGTLKISLGQPDPSALPITLGSSTSDVIKAMGTPDSIFLNVDWTTNSSWNYGDSRLLINTDGKVAGWTNKGNLKISM